MSGFAGLTFDKRGQRKMEHVAGQRDFVHFYEHDAVFRRILQTPEVYIQQFYGFSGILTPDCSLYRDMPLVLQMANTYMRRAVGCFFQEQGLYVIPNIRWGDERSYAYRKFGNIPFAFAGIEKQGIVAVSTYGCIRGHANRKHFKAGLHAMLEWLEPEIVLVHGAMPAEVFSDFVGRVEFHRYDDWITQKRRKVI